MGKSDGKVIITTEIDNKNFNRDIAKIEKRLAELDKKANEPIEINGVKISGGTNLTDEEISEYNQLADELEKLYNKKYELSKVEKEITQELNKQEAIIQKQNSSTQQQVNDTKKTTVSQAGLQEKANLEKDQRQLARLNSELEEMVREYNAIQKADIINSKDINEAKRLKKEIKKTVKEIEKLGGGKINVKGITDISHSFSSINKGLTQTVKKTAKWVGAIFGVRTAYNAIRSAMNTLSQYDDEMASNIQYITYALAYTLKPVIDNILNLVIKLLQYINYIAKAWTGNNLFKTADAFKSAQSNAKGLNKELNKTKASFDEINTVSSSSSSDTSGISTPNIDLTGLPEGEIPSWVQWIADHGKAVAVIIGLIGTAILGLKIAKFIKGFKDATSALNGFKSSTALMVAGLVLLIGNIVNLILNWDEMTAKEKTISIALAAIGAAFIALGYAIAAGISAATLGIGAIIAAIVALVTALVTLIAKWASEEKAIKDVETAQEDLKNAQEEYVNAQDSYIDAVDKATEAFDKLNEVQKQTGLSGEDLYKKVQDGTLDYAKMTDQQKEVYKAYLDNIKAQDNLKTSTEELEEAKKNEKLATWEAKLAQEAQNEAFKDGGEKAQKFRDEVIDAYNKGELKADEARDLIGKSMSEMSRSGQEAFMEDIPDAIKDGLDPKNYETTGQKIKKWFGDLWGNIKSGASDAWSKIKSWLGFSDGGVTYGSTTGFRKGGIIKMASGGIINQPGRGIPLTNAIGGEAGREGIVPLTDSQQMALLGEAIGKYVNINLTNVTKLDNRQIAKEQRRINAQNDFAFNR